MHPQGERRVRSPHGGRAGPLRGTYDPKRPVVCFDETSKQLVAEKRSPIPAKAGRQERFDYEYQRNGTRNLFMTCEPLAGWRHVAVTGRRTMEDFAGRLRPSDALVVGCRLP